MKMLIYCLFIWYSLFTACSSPAKENRAQESKDTVFVEKKKVYENFEKGKVIDTVYCSNKSGYSFALYLPSTYDPQNKYPSLCLFDPHAKGSLPVKKYKDLAEKYGFILACSNNAKNGIIGTKMTEIYTAFLGDIQNRLSVDFKRLYVGGFSGGARIASSILLKENGYAGLVGCGAGWMKVKNPLQNKFTYIGFAGNEDFNLAELRALDAQLDSKLIPHTLVEFDGKHEWPAAELFEKGFIWLEFDAMKKGDKPGNDSLISAFVAEADKELKLLESKKEWYRLYGLYVRTIAFTEGLTDNTAYKNAMKTLSEKEEMKETMKAMQDIYLKEEQLKQEYSAYIQSKDEAWWKQEMGKFSAIIKSDKDKEIRAMYKRLTAFLSLMAFSNATGAIRFNELSGAQHFLKVYQVIDPENPEHAYLYGIVYLRQNMQDKALEYLEKAVKMGFSDYHRLLTEKDFALMQTNARFQELVKKAKENQ
ncbi:MAG: hypothetical protein AB1458_12555 [Bacteroidota bacterium]